MYMQMNYLNEINPGFYVFFMPSNDEYERLLDNVANNDVVFINIGKPFDIKVSSFASKNSPGKDDILFIKSMIPNHTFNEKLYPVSDKLIFTIYKVLKESNFVVFESTGVDWEGVAKTAEFCYNYSLKNLHKTIVLVQPSLFNKAPDKQGLFAIDLNIMNAFNEWYRNKFSNIR